MRICSSTYQSLLEGVPDHLPETGGMLGGCDGIITSVVLDEGMDACQGCCQYSPDVDKLNDILSQWAAENIEFFGLFHSHFYGVSTLSEGDKSYIERILKEMPPSKRELFFPVVVFPERAVIPYHCSMDGDDLIVLKDQVILVDDSGKK